MEIVEILSHLLKGLSSFATELPKHYLEIATGIIGLLLVFWRFYTFGREFSLRW